MFSLRPWLRIHNSSRELGMTENDMVIHSVCQKCVVYSTIDLILIFYPYLRPTCIQLRIRNNIPIILFQMLSWLFCLIHYMSMYSLFISFQSWKHGSMKSFLHLSLDSRRLLSSEWQNSNFISLCRRYDDTDITYY